MVDVVAIFRLLFRITGTIRTIGAVLITDIGWLQSYIKRGNVLAPTNRLQLLHVVKNLQRTVQITPQCRFPPWIFYAYYLSSLFRTPHPIAMI